MLEYLVEHVQYINQVKSEGNTALYVSVLEGRKKVVKALVRKAGNRKKIDRYDPNKYIA